MFSGRPAAIDIPRKHATVNIFRIEVLLSDFFFTHDVSSLTSFFNLCVKVRIINEMSKNKGKDFFLPLNFKKFVPIGLTSLTT